MTSAWVLAGLLLAARSAPASADQLIRGISYGPVPLRSQEGASQLPQDDWMADEAVSMWGPAGRGDLKIMRQLGANMVRLYGNNPNNDHTNFLDTAHQEGLAVAAGMSDYPYYQQRPGNCQTTGFNCFSQVKPLYAQNLQKGFLTAERKYHPAVRYMNILNEPDLKMPAGAVNMGPDGPVSMCRSLVSAFDAMLDAEREAQVTGPLINFTATFSYAICASCSQFSSKPALGQMMQLDDAMRHPEKYGYTPRNDVTAAYVARFTHSFNTQNPASDLQHQFLDDYSASLPGTPVYIGEYHRVHADQVQDLSLIMDIAKNNELFLGISFFEYQVAYWKSGSEMDFGMFGLSDQVLGEMPYFGTTYSVYCLTPEIGPESATGASMPAAVARVFNGPGVDEAALCSANPLGVPLDQSGYEKIVASHSLPKMKQFVERVVEHLGATVNPGDAAGLGVFAQRHLAPSAFLSFADMAEALGGRARPAWMRADDGGHARCVADRSATPAALGPVIGWICGNAKTFSCDQIPSECKGSVYKTGDFVLSRYYQEVGGGANPLVDCYSHGAGAFASSELYLRSTGAAQCVEGASELVPPAADPVEIQVDPASSSSSSSSSSPVGVSSTTEELPAEAGSTTSAAAAAAAGPAEEAGGAAAASGGSGEEHAAGTAGAGGVHHDVTTQKPQEFLYMGGATRAAPVQVAMRCILAPVLILAGALSL